ncbi:MAG TPA: histidine phosphatase family protein [Kofleriaceae bacterium]|jgi:phosphohistidine phosphatase|nr:histidine phosphatase family protein [Kofleriaceae bacterium]
MHLFVVRHAIAEDAEPGQDDASRELTSDGARKFKRSVQGLREMRWSFTRVLTSPWTRAMQTAELLKPVTYGPTISTELLCDKPRPELFALIAETVPDAADDTRHATAVVGHEPWLSELVGWLAFGDANRGEGLDLKKGGVIWLEGTAVPGGMKLRAMLPPKVLRELR